MENDHNKNNFKLNSNKEITSQSILKTSGVFLLVFCLFLKMSLGSLPETAPIINIITLVLFIVGIICLVLSYTTKSNLKKKNIKTKPCDDDACSAHNASYNDVCNYCGSKLDKNQSVCSQCGHAQEIKCKKCGYINSSSNTYCTNCDNKLD